MSTFSDTCGRKMPYLTCRTRISTTIIAPTPLLAAYFVMMGRLIDILGPEYSRLSRKQCKQSILAI